MNIRGFKQKLDFGSKLRLIEGSSFPLLMQVSFSGEPNFFIKFMKTTNPTNDQSVSGLFKQQIADLNRPIKKRRERLEKRELQAHVRILFIGIIIGAACSLLFK